MRMRPNGPGGAQHRTRRIAVGLGIAFAVAVVLATIIGVTAENWALAIGVGVAIGASVFTAYVAGTSRGPQS